MELKCGKSARNQILNLFMRKRVKDFKVRLKMHFFPYLYWERCLAVGHVFMLRFLLLHYMQIYFHFPLSKEIDGQCCFPFLGTRKCCL